MFSNLRQNSFVYILHRNIPLKVEKGVVISVSAPVPKFGMSYTPQSEMVVDLSVNVDGEVRNFAKLPAGEDLATFYTENLTICANRDAINSEIESMKRKSTDIINSVEYHNSVVASCDEVYSFVNPEIKERQEQENTIRTLSEQVAMLTAQIDKMSKLIPQGGECRSFDSNNNKNKQRYEQNMGNSREQTE